MLSGDDSRPEQRQRRKSANGSDHGQRRSVVVAGGSSLYVVVQVVAIVVAASVRPLACVKSLVMLVVVQMSAHSLCAAWRPRHMNQRMPRFSLI